MQQLKAEIIYNKKIKGVFWRCAFRAPLVAKEAIPGQFININVAEPIIMQALHEEFYNDSQKITDIVKLRLEAGIITAELLHFGRIDPGITQLGFN